MAVCGDIAAGGSKAGGGSWTAFSAAALRAMYTPTATAITTAMTSILSARKAPARATNEVDGVSMMCLTSGRSELQRHPIHAIAQAGGLGAIVEHVAQVAAATMAERLDPLHAERR